MAAAYHHYPAVVEEACRDPAAVVVDKVGIQAVEVVPSYAAVVEVDPSCAEAAGQLRSHQ